MVIPRPVLEHAAGRHGIVCADDLRNACLTRKQINGLVTADQLTRVHSGVYRLTGAPRTWEQRQLAACHATGGVASHRAALKLWDIQVQGYDPTDWPVEVTVARENPGRPAGIIVHRSPDLDICRPPRRHSIPVTTPQRMLIDLGTVLSEEHVTRAVEQCVVSRLLSIATVRNELSQVAKRGRRGVRVLRSVLADWPIGDKQPDSVLELAFARLCKKAGLPEPAFQYELTLDGRSRRIDFAYPQWRLAIEVDGFACRTDRNVFQDERWRLNGLSEAGWRLLRFTWDDVLRHPDYVAAKIHSHL